MGRREGGRGGGAERYKLAIFYTTDYCKASSGVEAKHSSLLPHCGYQHG